SSSGSTVLTPDSRWSSRAPTSRRRRMASSFWVSATEYLVEVGGAGEFEGPPGGQGFVAHNGQVGELDEPTLCHSRRDLRIVLDVDDAWRSSEASLQHVTRVEDHRPGVGFLIHDHVEEEGDLLLLQPPTQFQVNRVRFEAVGGCRGAGHEFGDGLELGRN